MKQTLGQIIGIVNHSGSVKNDDEESCSLSINIDFSTASDQDIKNWLCSNRIIAGARPWRKLSLDEIKNLGGTTFIAQNIGHKVKSRKEQIQVHLNGGLPQNIAEFAVDHPVEYQKAMSKFEIPVIEDSPAETDTPTE